MKTHDDSRTLKAAGRKKAQAALALAVSLWIASGGVASAQDTVIEGDLFIGNAYGGKAESGSNAVGNTLTAKFSAITGNVYGGYAAEGSAIGNSVTLLDTSAQMSVYGGYAVKGNAVGNTVTAMLRSFIDRHVYGGYAVDGNATGNTVTLMNTINLKNDVNVYGGYTTKGDAIGNTVTLRGLEAAQVYGGFTGNGNATHNTVRLINSTVSKVYGGYKVTGGGDVVTGNTLNLLGVNLVTGTVENFETINIRSARWGRPALTALPSAIKNTPAINADGIIFTDVPRVRVNMGTTLIKNAMPAGYSNQDVSFRFGTTLKGTGKTQTVGKDLVFTVNTKPDGTPDVEVQEQTHNVLMGAGAGMATLSAGNDFIGAATEGLGQAANAGADGVSAYAQMGGGSIRQETGSHIDVKSWNAVLALGRKNEKPRGTFEYGAFFEYGRGNYTTHNGDLRGDGFTYYTGGGLLAKYTAKGGAYVEGSLRVGSVHGETQSIMLDENDEPYNCELDAPYLGAHIGVGKEIALKSGDSVDVYGKYFLNRRNSTSFDFGGQYELDALTSKVLRIGARYTIKRGGKWNYYAGAAYEHEFDGKATGTADGFAIRGTDPSGGSVRMELGATMEPDVKSPWKLDLNLSGFAGKKRGMTGGVSVAFMF